VFVRADFVVPLRLETPQFVLEPLGPQHNEADYAAWSSSMEHIHATPGWEKSSWPSSMTLDENRADLERHAADFESRTGFTYTVLSPDGDVIGCVYIYPLRSTGDGDAREPIAGAASVLSWVRVSRAELDVRLWQAVSAWLEADWPFEHVAYASRA
jgi:RimJ/RimL family protein N-acetyltransferase